MRYLKLLVVSCGLLVSALTTQAQTYKFLLLKNAGATDTAYVDGKAWYNPTYNHFTFIENGVAKHIGSTGSSTFGALTDGPGALSGHGLNYTRVNTGGTALEYRTVSNVRSDLSLSNVENTALSTWAGSTNITTLGTIGTGTWNGSSISTSYTDAKVKTVTGTSNRLTIGGTSTDPTFDISSSYVGQATITTLGTIGTGTWNGSSISTSYTDAKVKTVTGTSNRVTIGGTSTDPTFDISSSYVGQATITTLGTIGTGTWQGTAINDSYLATSYIKADGTRPLTGDWTAGAFKILIGASGSPTSVLHTVNTSTSTPRGPLFDQYNSGTNSSRVYFRKARGTFASPSVITTGDAIGNLVFAAHDGTSFADAAQFLVTSTGTISTGIVQSTMALQTANASGTLTTALSVDGSQLLTLPAYTTNGGLLYANGSGVVSQTGAGTSTTVLHGGTTPSYSAVSLTADVSGILPVANGGSGSSSVTQWLLASGGTLTGANTITMGTNPLTFTQGASSSGSPTGWTFNGGAHTGLSVSEVTDINFNLARTVNLTSGGGTIALNRAIRMQGPTYSAASAATITWAGTLHVNQPIAGSLVSFSSKSNQAQSGAFAIIAEGGLAVYDNAFTNKGFFYQSANATTVIGGGPAGEKITFGASNSITASVVFAAPSFSVSTAGNGITGATATNGNSLSLNGQINSPAAGSTSVGVAITGTANNQTSGAAKIAEIQGIVNLNGNATAANVSLLNIKATLTNTTGLSNLYGLTVETPSALNAFGTATSTATLQINGSGSNPTLKTLGAGTGTNYSHIAYQSDGTTIIQFLKDNGDFQVGLSSSKWGMFGTTAVSQQSVGTILVNNVTIGGTTSQIDDFTGAVYATDAATIRNDIYQLAKKVLALETADRNYGTKKD